MSQRGIEIDDRETAVVGGTIAAIVLAVVYSVSRVGFESHNPEVLRSLGLSLFLLSLPYWLWRILRRRDSDFVWVRSHPFLGLAVIAFTVLIALAAGPFAASVGLVLSVLGGVGSALVLFSWLRNGALRSRILFTLGAVVLSAWSAGVVWTSRYKLPLYWEQLMTNGNVHHDPLYVVAIGNMLRAYGVASTGLDGIPYTPYHYGTAWLYSRWADLVGTDLLSFYSLGYAVVLIPMFLASIALLAIEARKVSLLSRPLGWLRTNWWGWLALGIGTIGVIPDTALYGMAVWNAHVLISESYLGGLPVFLMAIATALIVWRAERRSLAFLFLFLPASLAVLAFLKVSLMVLLFALVVYVLLRTRVLWSLVGFASVVVMFAAGYLAYNAVSLPAHNGGVYPFHFMRYHVASGWQQFFPLVHLLWTWVYIAGRVYEERISDLNGVWAAVRARSIIDVELLLGVSLLGFLPGELIVIHGGSAIYFSDVPRWIALALVVARAGHWVQLWRERRVTPVAGRSWRLAHLLAVFIVAPFALTMVVNAIKPPLRLMRQNVTLRATIASQPGLENGQYFNLVNGLRDIHRLPVSDKGEMLLFIPQRYELYWRMFDYDDRCSYAGFVATAVSGMALLDGMAPFDCDVTDQYNMHAYKPRQREQTAEDVSDAAVCAQAARKGFRRVLFFEGDSTAVPRRRIVECVS
jgi:hypothetical protein